MLPLPIARPSDSRKKDHDKNQACEASRWLVLIEVVELRLGIFGKPEEGRAMNVLGRWSTLLGLSISIRRLRHGGHFAHGWFCRDWRMRKGRPAHSTETVFWAVIVPAMGAADVHCLKHIALFRWQKGWGCWKLLAAKPWKEKGSPKWPVTVDPACFTALAAAC